ncbi:MAG: 4Fe-4S binding protein [Pseudomonadota bacterium]
MRLEVYRNLCQIMDQRGGWYPGTDIPEFYDLMEELFTPEEAALAVAMPGGLADASTLAGQVGLAPEKVAGLLEGMADKGLVTALKTDGAYRYALLPLVPGIFELQLMRGTRTDRDRRVAHLIHKYEKAVEQTRGFPRITFPQTRTIPVDRMIKAGTTIHTYDQVKSYIEKYEPLSVSTCYCRHQAELIDPNDVCGKPNDVCMQFGPGAQFTIERGLARQISRQEAMEILQRTEEAGLVHTSLNRQDIDFLCNCCTCHCMIIKMALAQPKPALALTSGYKPVFDPDVCTACETCIDRCPADALRLGPEDLPLVDLERCFGCGVCATGCPSEAILMEAKPDAPVPPPDRKALSQALKAASIPK